jgi:hypothetical protein
MSEKVAIFLFAGPEAPCRLVHSFIFARDIAARGGEARIILEGAAPEWLLLLPSPDHKHHGTYRKAKEEGLIDAVCRACAFQADAVEAAEQEGFPLVGDALGHASLVPYMADSFRIVTL